MIRWLSLGAALLLLGCGVLDPEVGPERVGAPGFVPLEVDGGPDADGEVDGGEACDIVDSDPDTDVRFPDITSTVIGGYCGCHVDEGGVGRTIGGLDLRTHESALRGGRRGGADDIVPGDPCASHIVGKITGAPPFGSPMPFSRAPLTAAHQQLIIDWIAEGARP